MQNEIKFIAWEKNMKQIIPVYNIDFEKKMINTESAWRFFSEIELIQFTGINDKNGKEIHYGTILSFNGQIGVVKLGLHKLYNGWHLGNGWYVEMNNGAICELNDAFTMAESIGNIYENQELVQLP